MLNNDKICDLKTENTSVTVLHIQTNKIDDIKKYLRQKKKQASEFFEACPIVVDFSKYGNDDLDFIKSILDLIKAENMIPVGVKNIKNDLKQKVNEMKAPNFVTSEVNNTESMQQKESIAEKPIIKEKIIEKTVEKTKIVNAKSTKTIWNSVRGGQQIIAENQNLAIIGSVNENAEIMSTGSIVIKGSLYGKALAGISTEGNGDESATIMVDKFNATLVGINGTFKTFEDEIPESIKNQNVVIYLDDGKLTFKKI